MYTQRTFGVVGDVEQGWTECVMLDDAVRVS